MRVIALEATMTRIGLSLLTVGFVFVPLAAPQAQPLIVHEWGTITTRHAANGTPEGRLNRIARHEVLPSFVHQFEPAETRAKPQDKFIKSTRTPGRPDVTMRLETPVIYFHPAPGARPPAPFEVSVKFRGGILNEFYPNAKASVKVDEERINTKMSAGLIKGWYERGVLDNYVLSDLRWTGLSLKDRVSLPRTTSAVWLAPRRVKSSGVIAAGESERYLFYRGVAHLDALLQTERLATDVRLRSPQRLLWLNRPSMTLAHVWMADIRPNGRAAFRERTRLVIAKANPSQELGRLPLFAESDYSDAGLASLRQSMKTALIAEGLFEDEAEAMLTTWRESYFKTPGLRMFYTVPSEWTAYFLPLSISVPHQLTRVLIGRIDLLSP